MTYWEEIDEGILKGRNRSIAQLMMTFLI